MLPGYLEVVTEESTVESSVAVALHWKIGISAVFEQKFGNFRLVVFRGSVQRRCAFHTVCLANTMLQQNANNLVAKDDVCMTDREGVIEGGRDINR